MRKIKKEFRAIDYVFAHEPDATDNKILNVIATSYATAQATRPLVGAVATRRYRQREHRHKTCMQLFISEAQYYKLLNAFLRIAKTVTDKLNHDQPETAPAI